MNIPLASIVLILGAVVILVALVVVVQRHKSDSHLSSTNPSPIADFGPPAREVTEQPGLEATGLNTPPPPALASLKATSPDSVPPTAQQQVTSPAEPPGAPPRLEALEVPTAAESSLAAPLDYSDSQLPIGLIAPEPFVESITASATPVNILEADAKPIVDGNSESDASNEPAMGTLPETPEWLRPASGLTNAEFHATAKKGEVSNHAVITSNIAAPEDLSESVVSDAEVNEPEASDTTLVNDDRLEPGSPMEPETRRAPATPDALLPDVALNIPGPAEPPAPLEGRRPLHPPIYQPLKPAAPEPKGPAEQKRTPRPRQKMDSDLRLRVQLLFRRGGAIKSLMLIPDRRDGMPGEVEVSGTPDVRRLVEKSSDAYESIPLVEADTALRGGIELRAHGSSQRWRWLLSGRDLHVLAPGESMGLSGFVSVPRLRLNTVHLILTTEALREAVAAALTSAGCGSLDITDDPASGIPPGWILFRNVRPTQPIVMRAEADILNALCPAHEVEPQFEDGIRLERNTWLVGFPPRIRFTGELGPAGQVKIDGIPAQAVADGGFEAPGWDATGNHRLWFAGQSVTYSLQPMAADWAAWPAHEPGTGAAICGAAVYKHDDPPWYPVCVPARNPLLLGARPGEIFKCQLRPNVRLETVVTWCPFRAVWALPLAPMRADKRTSRLVLLEPVTPVVVTGRRVKSRSPDRAVRDWVTAINEVGRKKLTLAATDDEAWALWRQYRRLAKQLWKRWR